MDDLPLQVAQVDFVVIADDQVTDTGRGQVHRHRGAEATEADDQHGRCEQAHLARGIDLRQHDLPAVAKQLFVLHIQSGRASAAG